MNKGVSIIICCYNSANRLPETLKYLAYQQIPIYIPWEIVVVNNASTDNTVQVAKGEWNRYKLEVPLTIIEQPISGLSYARDKGIDAAKYEYCLFCDDDNWLDEYYISKAFQILVNKPNVGAVGGRGIPTISLPKWLVDYESFYALGIQGSRSGDVTLTQGCLYGAGLIFRKEAIHSIRKKGFKSLLSDRLGTKLLSGGDTELTFAFRLAGYKLYYDYDLVFYHALSPERFTLFYFIRLFFYMGYSWMALSPYHDKLNNMQMRYPLPNKVDGFYLLKRLAKVLLLICISTTKLKLSEAKKSFFECIHLLGQIWFIRKNYKNYKVLPEFLKQK